MLKNLNKTLIVFALAFSFAKAQDVSIAVGDTAFAGYTDDIVAVSYTHLTLPTKA